VTKYGVKKVKKKDEKETEKSAEKDGHKSEKRIEKKETINAKRGKSREAKRGGEALSLIL
jgi:hypothetical protein